ncbi:PhzF family phenazine biosynthesis protein [Cetobacterium sp. 8H]|uniref:PhzF family phenazine biosynthesis protein n=1 Tax=Cetobacterium sp. 8H TaxID=2759681 RepID=UPI00163B6B11|nr:PhzF family phenazine biosynthesis protein [Cetobacterium sp. 8H]MBC2851835.1 PhzF family phenazine biosynthesis protein [Cetobacterium sp. 8H]
MEYVVDVFTHKTKGGNKAGVIFNKEEIPLSECQKIATRLNLSETVFIKKIDSNIFELNFFTPKCEIEFCGHASLAAFYILKKLKMIGEGKYIARLKFIELSVIVEKNKIFLEQDDIILSDVIDKNSILESLRLKNDELDKKMDIRIAYSGLRDILIPVRDRNILNNLKINFKKIEEISKVNNVVGYHVYCIENDKIYCRNFAPLYGIEEEPATGSSNGALFGYLYINSIIKEVQPIAYQGENYGQISKVLGKIEQKENNKIKVYIGSEF